jgi:hypothetical protein
VGRGVAQVQFVTNQGRPSVLLKSVKWLGVGAVGVCVLVGLSIVLLPAPNAKGPTPPVARQGAVPAAPPESFSDATAAVTGGLKDPESVRFSDLRVRHVVGTGGSSVTVVCGLYNAKNSMGGYNGSSPFYFVREVADKRAAQDSYPHRVAGQTESVDGGDDPATQAVETDYSDLCVSTLTLSDDQVMMTTIVRQSRAEDTEMQDALRHQAVASTDSSNSAE